MQIEYSKEKNHELLDKWAFEKTTHLPFYYDMKKFGPANLWKRIITYLEWDNIGEMVIRIVSIGTSEANCERFISRQRNITGKNGINFKCETIEARLQINASSNLIEMRNFE